jgi:hypothetical protein
VFSILLSPIVVGKSSSEKLFRFLFGGRIVKHFSLSTAFFCADDSFCSRLPYFVCHQKRQKLFKYLTGLENQQVGEKEKKVSYVIDGHHQQQHTKISLQP